MGGTVRPGLLVTLSLAVALSGCGGESVGGRPSATDRAPRHKAAHAQRLDAPARVIRDWADALRAGKVARAAEFFAVPATVQNGTVPVRLHSRSSVRGFNLSLPCGARLLRTRHLSGYTVAEFVLTERRGPGGGDCTGVGGRAVTAFLIRGGKIAQWRRIPGFPSGGGTPPLPAEPAPAPAPQT
ncbi:MAG: hypothetical protein QOK31_1227 [Solirubrobacteraceae bacterium]|jgi:hypothetical protein|nr:hypothetical protein [Solirubrobacteraceae bacterium]